MVAERSLIDFLRRCRDDWSAQDLRAVQRKLRAIGVHDVGSLVAAARDESLNSRLNDAGEKTFTHQTLISFRNEPTFVLKTKGGPALVEESEEETLDRCLDEAAGRAGATGGGVT